MKALSEEMVENARNMSITLAKSKNGGFIATDDNLATNVSIHSDPKTAFDRVLKGRTAKVASKTPQPKEKAPKPEAQAKKTILDTNLETEFKGLIRAKKAAQQCVHFLRNNKRDENIDILVNEHDTGVYRVVFQGTVVLNFKTETTIDAVVSKSIVKLRYKDIYAGTNASNGDVLAQALARYMSPEGQLNTTKLFQVADDNDIETDHYTHLNPGQIRMNVGNRLRAKWRKGEPIKIGEKSLVLDKVDTTKIA